MFIQIHLKLMGNYDQKFYLLKPKMFTADIYYKVFITGDCIYFIKIGGQFHSRHAYKNNYLVFQSYCFVLVQKEKQLNLETEIDAKIHTGDVHELLQLKNNFSIEINIIEEVLLNKRGTFHTGFNDNGTISFMLKMVKNKVHHPGRNFIFIYRRNFRPI